MNETFKILFLSIPRIVYDRCLHDRCTDFGETVQYLINRFKDENIHIDIFDGSVPCATNKFIYNLFTKNYDLVVFFTDITDVHVVRKYCDVLKYLSPNTKNFIYGDSTLSIPQYFERKPFNAFHINGDQEYAIYSYVKYLTDGNKNHLKGVAILEDDKLEKYEDGVRLLPNEWAYPPLNLLPIDKYKSFAMEYKYSDYACSVYTSKGCPKKCKYCLCVNREGFIDRRRPVLELVDFLEENKDNFNLFKMHSADFLLDRDWVVEFCNEILKRELKIKWKTTTCFSSMDEEIISLISKAGCVGIGFGVETFYKDKIKGLKLGVDNFKNLMDKIVKYPITYKGYIMIGLENQTLEDVLYTIDILNQYGIKVRPSAYTPFHSLNTKTIEELDLIPLENWNKKECIHLVNKSVTAEQFYQILFDNK